MATTTNYSFPTPDDTALVKDGASAIRSLGSAVDTTVKALNPGTTAGDIDYYTTSTTKARVAIGTANQILRVNSGATAPEWATVSSGSLTLISTTTLSGASTTLSSIPQTYKNLYLLIYQITGNTNNRTVRVRPNSSNSGYYTGIYGGTTTNVLGGAIDLTAGQVILRTDAENIWAFTLNNYTSATREKPFTYYGRYTNSASDAAPITLSGYLDLTDAVTSIVFDRLGTDTFAGGTVELYGVN